MEDVEVDGCYGNAAVCETCVHWWLSDVALSGSATTHKVRYVKVRLLTEGFSTHRLLIDALKYEVISRIAQCVQ